MDAMSDMHMVLKLQGSHPFARYMRAAANRSLGQSTAAMSDFSSVRCDSCDCHAATRLVSLACVTRVVVAPLPPPPSFPCCQVITEVERILGITKAKSKPATRMSVASSVSSVGKGARSKATPAPEEARKLSALDKHRYFNLLREAQANRSSIMCVVVVVVAAAVEVCGRLCMTISLPTCSQVRCWHGRCGAPRFPG